MKTTLVRSLVCAVMVLGLCVAQAVAQDVMQSPEWQKEVTIDLKDVTVGKALDGLLRSTGISYSLEPDLEYSIIPALTAKDVPLEAALKSLLRCAGLTYRAENDILYISQEPGSVNPTLKHVTINLTGANLGEAIECLFRGTGLNYSLTPGVADLPVSSVTLRDVPMIRALNMITESAGVTYRNMGGVFEIRLKSAPAQAPAPPSGQVTVTTTAASADPWQRRVNVDAKDATLAAVAEKLFVPSGLNFSIDEKAGMLFVKALQLRDVPLGTALKALVKTAGATYRVEQNVVQITAKQASGAQVAPVSLDLKEVLLREAIDSLFRGTGLNYAMDASIGNMQVTLSLRNVPFETALESLTRAAGLYYRVDNGVYRICGSQTAATPQANTSSGKCTEEVTLKQATADYILATLGLDAQGKLLADSPVNPNRALDASVASNAALQAAGLPKISPPIPAGIESITPGKSEDVVVVAGTKEAVDEMKTILGLLDVKPRGVQVKAEYLEIPPKVAEKLKDEIKTMLEPKPFARPEDYAATADAVKDFRKKLQAAGGLVVNKPILSLLDRVGGEISVQSAIPTANSSSGEKWTTVKATLSAIPHINGDNTITLAMTVSFEDWRWVASSSRYEQGSSAITTARRAPSGMPFVIGGFSRRGATVLIFVTATVIRTGHEDDAVDG